MPSIARTSPAFGVWKPTPKHEANQTDSGRESYRPVVGDTEAPARTNGHSVPRSLKPDTGVEVDPTPEEAAASKPEAEPREVSTDRGTQLMLRARDGDDEAFEELFRLFGTPLFNLALRIVGHRDRAEELVQEAFLRIYRRRESWEPRAKFGTYAYRVVANLCLNEIRRARFRTHFTSIDGEAGWVTASGKRQLADERTPTAEAESIGGETARRIRSELDGLPARHRTAILLSRVEGFSYQEIAEILDTSTSAVKSMVFRATRTLRRNMADLIGSEESEEDV